MKTTTEGAQVSCCCCCWWWRRDCVSDCLRRPY